MTAAEGDACDDGVRRQRGAHRGDGGDERTTSDGLQPD